MYHAQCTMYHVPCPMYHVPCTMYHVQCTMYSEPVPGLGQPHQLPQVKVQGLADGTQVP